MVLFIDNCIYHIVSLIPCFSKPQQQEGKKGRIPAVQLMILVQAHWVKYIGKARQFQILSNIKTFRIRKSMYMPTNYEYPENYATNVCMHFS